MKNVIWNLLKDFSISDSLMSKLLPNDIYQFLWNSSSSNSGNGTRKTRSDLFIALLFPFMLYKTPPSKKTKCFANFLLKIHKLEIGKAFCFREVRFKIRWIITWSMGCPIPQFLFRCLGISMIQIYDPATTLQIADDVVKDISSHRISSSSLLLHLLAALP